MLRLLALLALIAPGLAACGSRASPAPQPGEVRAAAPRAPATVTHADAAALAAGNAQFAGRLLALLARSRPTVALSPFSISDTLAMTYAGARGRTAAEMASALDFRLPPDRLRAAFNALGQEVAAIGTGSTKLRIANALFGQRGTAFRRAFLRVLARDYGTGIRTMDFAASPDAARSAVNAWVSQATGGKIPQLLGSGDVNSLTRLLLADAVYLNARWESPFSADDTSPAPFHVPAGTIQVPTMHQAASFDYASHPGYRVLELRYRGDRLAFDILLPDPGGLRSLLGRIARSGPLPLMSGLAPQRVQVALPKLMLRTHFELADALSALGMPLAFSSAADLSGIAGSPGQLSIQHVVHEAYVRVDEADTEAAAATGAVVGVTALPPLPAIQFKVDRPFVFVLRDRPTQAILFLGVVSNP
jgi:serpin B